MKKIFTKEQELNIVSDYKKRIFIKHIMKKYDTYEQRIYDILHKYNVVRSRKPLSQIQEKQIVNEYKNGISAKELSKKYNKSTSLIYRILNINNVRSKKCSEERKKLIAMKDELINLYTKECFTVRELAKQFDTSNGMMYYLLKEFKVTFRLDSPRLLTNRNVELNICKDYLACRNSKTVGKKYEISHVQVLQIVRAYGIMTSDRFRQSCRRVP